MKLVVVDVQPEYESNTTFDVGDMLRSAAEDYTSILFLFNGEDTLGMISEDDLKNYYFEKLDYDDEAFDELLSKSEFFDKGYGFFRDVMDSDVCFDRNQIVKIVKYMLDNDFQDLRELSEEDVEAIGVNELLFDDLEDYGFNVPELSEVLPAWSGSDLVGGARYECMAEVEILGSAQGLTFNHVDDFIYEGKKMYSRDEVLTEALLREYIRELLTEAAKGLTEFEERGMYIAIEDLGDMFEIKLYDFDPAGREPGTPDVASPAGPQSYFPDGSLGLISAMKESSPDNGPCLDGFTITWVSVSESGWGPLLYDLAMELATSKGSGLTPDRRSVSFQANKVWDYYLANRSDVEMVQMDDLSNRLTPGTKEDNCAMTLAYERGLESGTFWDEDNQETPWDPYGKEVLEQSPLSKMGVWKGAANIDAIKAMDRWIEI